jgi:hypothetical protein
MLMGGSPASSGVPFSLLSPPATASVIACQNIDGSSVRLTFSEPVSSVGPDVSGLVAGDGRGDHVIAEGSTQADIALDDGVAPGDAWAVDATDFQVTTVSGRPLVSSSGIVS